MPPINPDETLKVIVDLASRMSKPGSTPNADEAARLAHLVEVLDQHLCTGGPLPQRWNPNGSPVRSSTDEDPK